MANKITYWAILGRGSTIDRPQGLLRRLEHDIGFEDEGLNVNTDLSWSRTSMIIEREHDGLGEELMEVSHEQASKIVQYFRERLAGEQA
jgi:tRNA(His) 5'-end guanylyltransferase